MTLPLNHFSDPVPGASPEAVIFKVRGQDNALATALNALYTLVLAVQAGPFIGSYLAVGSFSILTGQYTIIAKRLQLTGTQRLTIAGTGHLSLIN